MRKQKRVLLTDNGSEIGFHLAHRFLEEGYWVDMITDTPMDNIKVHSHHINWYDTNHISNDRFVVNTDLLKVNKTPYDIICFNHFINGGASETEFLPYVPTDFEGWNQAHYSNVIFTFQIIKELSNYIKQNTNVVWLLKGFYDYNWKDGYKYGSSSIYENSRISILKSFSIYMHGIYSGINIGDISSDTSMRAFEILETIKNITKKENGSVLFRNGQKLLE